MAGDRQHHKSKKNRYTIVLVHDEDASKAKNFTLAPWQFIMVMVIFAFLSASFVLVILTYTPVGQLIPLSNPGLENRYNRELVYLNKRMTNLMEQLVELRAYNVKLRQAFGEKVTLTDSGIASVVPRDLGNSKEKFDIDKRSLSTIPQPINLEQRFSSSGSARPESTERIPLTFPAILPTEGYLTRGFEPEQNHYGLDFAGKRGTLVVAVADGNVVFSGWTNDDGYIVIISHAGGFMTFYKHNQSLLKSVNAFVRRGEPIAMLGDSGITSYGPHLHFEIWKDGNPVDPLAYLINFYL